MNLNVTMKCSGQRYLAFGESPTEDVMKELELFDSDIWKRYSFRTKFEIIQHNDGSVPQSTHQNTHTLPLYWQLNSWKLNEPITIYRFTECERVFHWIDHLHTILKEQNVEDGVVVKAMFAKLLPKQTIPPHVDGALPLRVAHRYHWVISSDQTVQFMIKDESRHWPNGHIFELNNIFNHGVINPSETERIHFIMDIMPSKYINHGVTYIDITPEMYASREMMFAKN